MPASFKRPAVFVDRDGTLVEEVNFLHRVEDLQIFPFAEAALRLFRSHGFAIVVVTQHELGIVAVAVGWLVGQAVVVGSGGKRGLRLQLLSVLIALATMAGAEYFILREAVVAYLAEQVGASQAATLPVLESHLEMARATNDIAQAPKRAGDRETGSTTP